MVIGKNNIEDNFWYRGIKGIINNITIVIGIYKYDAENITYICIRMHEKHIIRVANIRDYMADIQSNCTFFLQTFPMDSWSFCLNK